MITNKKKVTNINNITIAEIIVIKLSYDLIKGKNNIY